MKAHIEDLKYKRCAVLRVFEDSAEPLIDPYLFAGTLVWIDKETVELKGVTGNCNSFVKSRGSITQLLHKMEVKLLIWHRIKNGRKYVVKLKIKGFCEEEG